MISSGSRLGKFLVSILGGSLLLGVAGCGRGEDDSSPPVEKAVSGTQLCGGKAFSADAAKGLEVITRASRFGASADDSTIEKTAAEVYEAYPRSYDSHGFCRIYTAPDQPYFELRITWQLHDRGPAYAVASVRGAAVKYPCRGGRLPDSLGVSYVLIEVDREVVPGEPEDDPKAVKNAYATAAHSVASALAKELRCEKNSGLRRSMTGDG